MRVTRQRVVAPEQVARPVESLKSARIGVVDRDQYAWAYLVGIGGVVDARWMSGPVDGPVEAEFINPVPVDLGDEIVAVRQRERSVRAAPPNGWIVQTAVGRLPEDLSRGVGTGSDEEYPAILDVGSDEIAVRKLHGIVGVVDLVRTTSGLARCAVAVDDVMSGHVDDADDEVVLLRHDDLTPVGSEESVVGDEKGLPRS